jgi:PilZ domain
MIATSIQIPKGPINTRRWPRYQTHLPVLISCKSDLSRLAVPGLASEISQTGMALYGGVPLQPGEVMEVEFRTPSKRRVAGIVRNRSGYCFGLEFLSPMSSGDAIANVLRPGPIAGKDTLPFAYVGGEPNARWRVWLIAIATVILLLALTRWGSRPAEQNSSQVESPSQASLTLVERILVYLDLAELPPVRAEIGNPNVQVWVDRHTALYYCAGSELYGKTPGGHFTTQRDAQLDQFEPAARNYCK